MIISALKIPDGTFEAYEKHNGHDPKQAMAQQLIRFQAVSPTSRVVLVPQEDRAELERVLGVQIESSKELVRLVKRLLTIQVDGISLEVPYDVAEKIHSQAEFSGITTRDYLKQQTEWSLRQMVGEA